MRFLLIVIVFAFSGLCDCVELEWVSDENGNVPAYAVIGGREEKGQYLYVCKNYFHGEQCSGKVGYHIGNCMTPWGGKENDVYDYFVLTAPPWALYTLIWRGPYSKGDVPSNAVYIGSGVYVGRYKRKDNFVPGKVVRSKKVLYYGYGGKEFSEKKGYEVLAWYSRHVTHYQLTNVEYDLSKATETFTTDFQPVGATKRVTNNSPLCVTTEVSIYIDKTDSISWSNFESIETVLGMDTIVKAGIPFVKAKAEWGISATSTYEYSYGKEHTTTVTTSHSITATLPPQSNVEIYMVAKEAYITVPFKGDLTVYFSDGNTYTSRVEDGIYDDVHMTSYEARIEGDTGMEQLKIVAESEANIE